MTFGNVQHIIFDKQSIRPLVIARDGLITGGRADTHPRDTRVASPFSPIDVAETANKYLLSNLCTAIFSRDKMITVLQHSHQQRFCFYYAVSTERAA